SDTGNITAAGTVSGGVVNAGSSFNLGNAVFAFGSPSANQNAYVGFSGSVLGKGTQNTANGYEALFSEVSGSNNTASGVFAMYSNTTGNFNTADGYDALYYNNGGYQNTATGTSALQSNTTGFNNTALGYFAGPDPLSPNLSYS